MSITLVCIEPRLHTSQLPGSDAGFEADLSLIIDPRFKEFRHQTTTNVMLILQLTFAFFLIYVNLKSATTHFDLC